MVPSVSRSDEGGVRLLAPPRSDSGADGEGGSSGGARARPRCARALVLHALLQRLSWDPGQPHLPRPLESTPQASRPPRAVQDQPGVWYGHSSRRGARQGADDRPRDRGCNRGDLNHREWMYAPARGHSRGHGKGHWPTTSSAWRRCPGGCGCHRVGLRDFGVPMQDWRRFSGTQVYSRGSHGHRMSCQGGGESHRVQAGVIHGYIALFY
mmetsp:Transcript_37037/g.51404  ORF Transcript_37037/g.51404 Transcript_37037/m.51404 type:complete len:210 (+) Transcript_37037:129-758(+)